jgi:taurine dioxygenase
MRNVRFEVLPTSGALGAELLGIDLSQSLDAEGAADIRQALNDHGVVFFRDQRLSPEQHIALPNQWAGSTSTAFSKPYRVIRRSRR